MRRGLGFHARHSPGLRFSPEVLFAGGVQGAWFDPSDSTTLFSDRAGTTPCAAPGAGALVPVGLMLDKSQGLTLGSELVGNAGGPFTTTTGWVNTSLSIPATPSVVNGRLRITADVAGSGSDPRVYTTITGLTIGKAYKVTFVGSSGTATSCAVAVTNTVPAGNVTGGTGANVVGTDVAASFIRIAAATTEYVRVVVNDSTGTDGKYVELSSITVKALSGNHAIAANDTTARPELSARVNLLTYTEEFDNAAWAPVNSTITPNQTTAPNGTSTADLYSSNATNGQHYIFTNNALISAAITSGVTYVWSIYLKKGNGATAPNIIQLSFATSAWASGYVNFNISTGAKLTESGYTGSISDAGNGWWRCSITATATATTITSALGGVIFTNNNDSLGRIPSYVDATTSNVYIWGADLRPANIGTTIPAYQRVADQYTYDTVGFPRYLAANGTSSAMSTPANVNLSGTDKVTVFAGVRKLSDAAGTGVVAEHGVAGAGLEKTTSFLIASSTAYDASGRSYSTIIRSDALPGPEKNAAVGSIIYAAPITNVYSAAIDRAQTTAANEIQPRVNGIVPTTVIVADANPTGNFASWPLYIGSRNNASLWLNGNIYSLIVAGTAVSAGNITATEQWVAGKTGITVP